jgi:hypothetical protein
VTSRDRTLVVEASRATNRTIRGDLWQRMATERPSDPSPSVVRLPCSSCKLTTCGLLGHGMVMACQDRDRDCVEIWQYRFNGSHPHEQSAVFQETVWRYVKNCKLDVAVTSTVPPPQIKRLALPATRTAVSCCLP